MAIVKLPRPLVREIAERIVRTGESIAQVARDYNINRKTLYGALERSGLLSQISQHKPRSKEEAFYRFVPSREKDACWQWIGPVKENGRPYFIFRKRIDAASFSYNLYYGTSRQILRVKPNCGNPLCVNPAHIEIAPCAKHKTAVAKKVNSEVADQIRLDYASGEYTYAELARKYHVTTPVIHRLLYRLHPVERDAIEMPYPDVGFRQPGKRHSSYPPPIPREELAEIVAQIKSGQTSLTAAARSYHTTPPRLMREFAEAGVFEGARLTRESTFQRKRSGRQTFIDLEASQTTAESAFQRLVVRQENGCWIWQGRFKKGSCEFIWKGHGLSARRFAYQLTHPHLPDGEYVYVSCGNPRCVNPAHLYIKRVDLIPYKESWPAEFQALAQHLRQALGDLALRIDHIGSTSLPGLAAKDEIDIQVTVAALDDQVIAAMTALGYTRPDGAWRDHCPPDFNGPETEWEKLLFCPPEGQRCANVHLRIQGRANQRYALLFRDYLRMHPAAAKAYTEFKRRLTRFITDPLTCTEVEDPVKDLIYLAAEEWAVATHWQAGPCDA